MDLENNGGGGGGGVELATAEPAANALGICEITVLCSLAVVLVPFGVLLLSEALLLSSHAKLQMSDHTIHFQSKNDEAMFMLEMVFGVCAVALGSFAAARLCCG